MALRNFLYRVSSLACMLTTKGSENSNALPGGFWFDRGKRHTLAILAPPGFQPGPQPMGRGPRSARPTICGGPKKAPLKVAQWKEMPFRAEDDRLFGSCIIISIPTSTSHLNAEHFFKVMQMFQHFVWNHGVLQALSPGFSFHSAHDQVLIADDVWCQHQVRMGSFGILMIFLQSSRLTTEYANQRRNLCP